MSLQIPIHLGATFLLFFGAVFSCSAKMSDNHTLKDSVHIVHHFSDHCFPEDGHEKFMNEKKSIHVSIQKDTEVSLTDSSINRHLLGDNHPLEYPLIALREQTHRDKQSLFFVETIRLLL